MAEAYCVLSWPRPTVAQITLNQPNKLNAINVEMLKQWRSILDQLQHDRQPNCLIITGKGRAFSAGADIKSTIEVAKSHNGDLGSILSAYYNPVIMRLRELPCPIISVVNGLAVGVGFSFALQGDIVLASETAYFWANFSEIGLATDGAMSYLLPRSIGYHQALAYTLLAKRMTVEEALKLGLVYEIVQKDNLMARALELAQALESRSSIANREIKALMRDSFENAFEDQLHAESISQARAGYSNEAKKAIMKFIAKRKR